MNFNRREFLQRSTLGGAAVPVLGSLAAGELPAGQAHPGDELQGGFAKPPDSAKPWVYWFWLKGNISRDGVTRELESFHRLGNCGVILFNGQVGPVLGEPTVKFFSPEWRELFRHTVAECERLGLKIILHNADGWSHSGGFWIPVDKAMQRVVHSELRLKGPARFDGLLPQPWQNRTYADIAVLAVPTPPGDSWTMRASGPRLSTNGKADGPLTRLVDGDPETGVRLQPPAGTQPLWLRMDFDGPVRASSIRCCAVKPEMEGGHYVFVHSDTTLQAAGDRENFRDVAAVPPVLTTVQVRGVDVWGWKTATFAPVEAASWRLVFRGPVELREVELIAGNRIQRWEDKSGQVSSFIVPEDATPEVTREMLLDPAATLDITRYLDQQGRFHWDVPEGEWTILRMGHTWTGGVSSAPSGAPADQSPEVDKLDPATVEFHYHAFVGEILKDVGRLAGRTLTGVEMDSWEGGSANWTPAMAEEFRRRRGYDLSPWLPALAGRIVGDSERCDRFLFDYRRTISELLADNIFTHYRSFLEPLGIQLWAEALGPCNQRGTTQFHHLGDSLQCKGRVDVPMAEFWVDPPRLGEPALDTKEAAAAAHIYGKPRAAAEAFTALLSVAWTDHPGMLKILGDLEFCLGINTFVLSESVHQPWPDRSPGVTLRHWGIHFQEPTTWFPFAGGWLQYLARCQYLLQQGKFVADVCYYLGEDSPVRLWEGALQPKLPAGYDYDGCSADALLTRFNVKDGRIVLPDGMSYRLLVLSDSRRMTPEVARKIKQLISDGATVFGSRPEKSPSLAGYPQCDEEVRRLANEMWGDIDGRAVKEHRLGQGRMLWGMGLEEALRQVGSPADFKVLTGQEGVRLTYVHRRLTDAEIYFVANQRNLAEKVECAFRVTGKQPEIWDPITGEHWDAGDFRQTGEHTTLPLELEAAQSYFVVFRRALQSGKAGSSRRRRNFPLLEKVQELGGPWTVKFDSKWGGPESVTFQHLEDWARRPEEGIKYYSGTAKYQKTFDLAKSNRKAGERIYLDLGGVRIIAGVRLNGKDLGDVWTAPWRVEITGAVKPSGNELEIAVANLWVNRLVREATLAEDKRLTWTTYNPYKADSPLLESGLLGPVTILAAR